MARKLSRRVLASYVASQLLAGAPSQPLVQQLAAYLVEHRRTKELDLIVQDVRYYLAEKGYVTGTVVSAHELSDATKQALGQFTKQRTGAQEVTLSPIVDPTVLGGVRLSLPGKEFDATIARALTTLKTRYKKA